MSNVGKRGKLKLETRLRAALLNGTNTRLEHHEIERVIQALSKPQAREVAGPAEPEVGRAIYERIEKLLTDDPNGLERQYLSHLVESVEEVGGYDGPQAREDAQPVAWRAASEIHGWLLPHLKHMISFNTFHDVVVKALRSDPTTSPSHAPEAEKLLKALRDQSWDLRCFNIPTGGDDYDIGWRVIGHWLVEPRERTIAEVFSDDPDEAIRQALAALQAEQKGGA